MLINLPVPGIIALNVVGWPVIQIAVARVFLGLPATCFNMDFWLFRCRNWENDGRIYARLSGVRRWKQMLPDGVPFLRGFAKKRLVSSDRSYLRIFIRETCRGESAHWTMLLATPLFFLWNPIWADFIMCVYAVVSNLPCIITQRYNRIRLQRVVKG